MFPIFAGNSASTGYNLTRSLRFRASASAYLNRTPASAGNQKTWTYSNWIKRGTLGVTQNLFTVGTGSGLYFYLRFLSTDVLEVFTYDATGGTYAWQLQTTQVFRDPSAWYHIVISTDTTQATASNRVKIYVNGTQVTAFAVASYPSLNYDTRYNVNVASYINSYVSSAYFDGYSTELNSVDGQALTPSSFGSTNALTGVWQPARYTGTYGTNGFYLPFTDNSGATSTTIGKDFSGNSNNWTPNNISVTAGTTYDSMTDVPTLTSATAGNFAVLNPLDFNSGTVSNGNLQWASTAAVGNGCFSTFAFDIASTTNKYYWEFTISSGDGVFGIVPLTTLPSNTSRTGSYSYYTNGSKYSGTSASAYGATFTSGDIIGVTVGSGTITFYKNNTSQGSAFTGLTGNFKPAIWEVSGTFVANFGQRPFTYTPPTGFVALNTYNLPTSTIVKGNTVMDVNLWAGTGATLNVVNAAGFKPDLVWGKSRSNAYNHVLVDSVRGANIALASNATAAEVVQTQGVMSFNSNGFTLGTSADSSVNNAGSGQTYVGWQWQAGQGTTSSNTNGTITSTVSVNASAGFSVVTYTGTLITTPSPPPTVGHGLGVAPSLVISKSRSVAGVDSGAWFVWTSAQATDNYLRLNTTAASASISGGGGGTMVAPTSSVFSTPYLSGSNVLANNYVAYCWTPIAGFSAFGSYTGNGSADGPFIYTGFRPKWVMVKGSSFVCNWFMLDSARNTYNAVNSRLVAEASLAEDTNAAYAIDFLSNGFKLRSSSNVNASGTYIYMAFAESPFRNSLAF